MQSTLVWHLQRTPTHNQRDPNCDRIYFESAVQLRLHQRDLFREPCHGCLNFGEDDRAVVQHACKIVESNNEPGLSLADMHSSPTIGSRPQRNNCKCMRRPDPHPAAQNNRFRSTSPDGPHIATIRNLNKKISMRACGVDLKTTSHQHAVANDALGPRSCPLQTFCPDVARTRLMFLNR